MPLKHHTETALMIILGFVISLAGIAAALLPPLPEGFFYWLVLLLISIVYPLALRATFRVNRADYEFRLLHWFPAGILVFWFILQILAPRFVWATILLLGFFYLWSLPLVALGLLLTIMFALHVIRRWTVRVGFLSVLLMLFIGGSWLADANRWNDALRSKAFPTTGISQQVAMQYDDWIGRRLVWVSSSESSLSSSSVASSVSASSVSSSLPLFTTSIALSSSYGPLVDSGSVVVKKPHRLPRSGGEALPLFVAFLALYCHTIHRRAAQRA